MQWLNKIVDEALTRQPKGEIIVSSGVSPSGTYHLGTLREVLTAEAITRLIKKAGRNARHIHVVDDLDPLRKIPAGVPDSFEKYLGQPLCDVPAPDGSERSYADYYLADLMTAAKDLKLKMEIVRAHEKYRTGFFVSAIEKALINAKVISEILAKVSGHKVGEEWSPVQVNEGGYLKNRPFVAIDTKLKKLTYLDKDGHQQVTDYQKGEVKLNWRIDWPARWWRLGVNVEPFGRDHATKGGSYDTGKVIAKEVFGIEAPLPIPYHFINRSGETKKMSKSKGDTITAAELLKILPGEIVWYFLLRYPPQKQLFFDEGPTLMRLVDEYAELTAKPAKTAAEQQLLEICGYGLAEPTVSSVPFSHLVASYQASLKDVDKTLAVIARTEHIKDLESEKATIRNELRFIEQWLKHWASDDVKFELLKQVDSSKFNEAQKQFLAALADKIENSPGNADGEWFHKLIYDLKADSELPADQLFTTLYKVLIGQDHGPRAGWFLSILPKDWLIKRLRPKD